MILIDVLGTPAPKGSSRAFMVGKKGGPQRAVMAPGGSTSGKQRAKGWEAAVREAASDVIGEVSVPPYVDLALLVTIVFRMTRPSGHWGKGKNAGKLSPSSPAYPRTKPDIDKLARTTLDALTGIAFDDDSRIVRMVVAKEYARPGHEGARITVEEWKA